MQTGSLQQSGAASGRPWRSILEMQGSDGSGAVPGFPSGPRSDGLFAAPGRGITARWAWGVFAVLFLVHLLESLDRWLLPAVLRPLSEELELTDAQAGWLATVLLISYALWGPFIANVVLPNMRAVAYAVAMAATHLLGDLWSPTLMGWVSDTFGQDDSMATPFGRALAAIGATPKAQPGHDPENLVAAVLTAVPALVIAGVVLLAGGRHLPREMALMIAKLRAAPSRVAARPGTARP